MANTAISSINTTQMLYDTVTLMRDGDHQAANATYHSMAVQLMGDGTTQDEYEHHVHAVEKGIKASSLSLVQQGNLARSKAVITKGSNLVNREHNHLINTDPKYRQLFEEAILEQTKRDAFNAFPKADPNKYTIGFRGMQDWDVSDSHSFAKPAFQFTHYTTTFLASGGQRHNGGGLIFARINDPATATKDEVDAKMVGWTRGYTCLSYDSAKAAKYARKDFPGAHTNTEGFIYIYASSRVISMDEHMYADLPVHLTTSARYDYEHITPIANPTLYVGAIPIHKDGSLGKYQENPNASPEAKTTLHQYQDECLETLIEGSERGSTVASLDLDSKRSPGVERFEQSLPQTEKEHLARVEERKSRYSVKITF